MNSTSFPPPHPPRPTPKASNWKLAVDRHRRRKALRQLETELANVEQQLSDAYLVIGSQLPHGQQATTAAHPVNPALEQLREAESALATVTQSHQAATARKAALVAEAQRLAGAQDVESSKRRFQLTTEQSAVEAELRKLGVEREALQAKVTSLQAQVRAVEEAAKRKAEGDRQALLAAGREALNSPEPIAGIDPTIVAHARALVGQKQTLEAEVLAYQQDLAELPPVSRSAVIVGRIAIGLSVIGLLIALTGPYPLAWCVAAALLATFVIPPWTWRWAVLRVATCSVTFIAWAASLDDAFRHLPGFIEEIPVLAILAALAGGALFAKRKVAEYRTGWFALVGLGCVLVGAQVHVSVLKHMHDEEVARAEAQQKTADEKERQETLLSWDYYVAQARDAFNRKDTGNARQLVDRLLRAKPADSEMNDLSKRVDAEIDAQDRRDEQQREYQRKIQEAADQHDQLQQVCANACIAPRERCYSQYGRGAAECTDLTLQAAACIQEQCR